MALAPSIKTQGGASFARVWLGYPRSARSHYPCLTDFLGIPVFPVRSWKGKLQVLRSFRLNSNTNSIGGRFLSLRHSRLASPEISSGPCDPFNRSLPLRLIPLPLASAYLDSFCSLKHRIKDQAEGRCAGSKNKKKEGMAKALGFMQCRLNFHGFAKPSW